ncbi:hypothetical protein SteCoe_25022 [Stentor coeruleus]|uniref:TRAF-type domain-containing protein n=1 Tax=Stentor coeruleus TaxID=5963 RepID=A0A1R2BG64_9CILI|nr:hypothetical protein SteCoe_25022 [Stentor coeruleus]
MENQETVVCDICDKEIATLSIQVHKVHCERNTIKCQSCDKKLNRYDLEKHNNEFHVLKKCEACQASIEIRYFSTHNCPKKPLICEFCEASFPADLYRPHIFECGNRTDQCPRCREYVKKRDYIQHRMKNDCKPYSEPRINIYEEMKHEQSKYYKHSAEGIETSIKKPLRAEEPIKKPIQQQAREPVKKGDISSKNAKTKAEDNSKSESYNKNMKSSSGKSGTNKIGKSGVKSVPNIQSKPENSKMTALRGDKFNPTISPKISPKPIQYAFSPKINSKIAKPENQDKVQDFDDPNEDEIPQEIYEDSYPPPKRDWNFYSAANEQVEPLPQNLLPSNNYADIDDQILKQILAESEKDGFGITEDERIINEIVMKSLKDR